MKVTEAVVVETEKKAEAVVAIAPAAPPGVVSATQGEST